VVCISSEDGAGAAETAPLVAESLSFRLIDEEILTRAAVEAGVDQEVVADVERRKSRLMRLLEGLGPAGMVAGPVLPAEALGYDQPPSDSLRGLIRSVIEDTAATGQVVLVSHAASLALGAREDVLRIMVTAPADTRQRRIAAALDVDDKEAGRLLKRSDAGRADYIKRFYGVGAELPSHYDLVINTDRITPDVVARLIVDAVNRSA
jgi:Cytidylate kinase-like family